LMAGEGFADILQVAAAWGLSPETVRAARLRRVGPEEIARLVRLRPPCGGILIPYPGDGYCRVRLDTPWQAPGWDRPARYLSPPGAPPRLYIPPNLPPGALERGPLVITEGEKKALRTCEAGIPCVATAGIWAWRARGPDGERLRDAEGLLAEFKALNLAGRAVVLVYDSDLAPDHPGYPAYIRLAAVLEDLGAGPIRILTLPASGSGKVGLDDFLNAGRTAEEFWALARSAPVYGAAFDTGRPSS